jgi:hypothetical protein
MIKGKATCIMRGRGTCRWWRRERRRRKSSSRGLEPVYEQHKKLEQVDGQTGQDS